MDARESTFFALLDGSKHYVIPHYQRLYSWEFKHCKTLFDDLESLARDKQKKHFMGSIVYISHMAKADGVNEFVVIDGQQRLTTLSLVVLAVIEALDLDDEERTRRLNRTIRNSDEKRETPQYFKLKLTRADNESFQHIVHSVAAGKALDAEDSRIRRNFEFLRQSLKDSITTPQQFWDAITRLDMVYISLDSSNDDPQAIFESLNSTGKDLSPTDLIRNFVLMDLKPERQVNLYENYWAKIESLFKNRKDNEFEEFTRAHLALQQEKYPRATDVYFEFKGSVRESYNDGYTPEDVLGNFRDSAKTYANIHWVSGADEPKVESALADYRALRLKIMHPLLMPYAKQGIANANYNPHEFYKALGLLESYLVRRTFSGLKANSLDNSVAKIFSYMHKSSFDGVNALADALLSLRGKSRFPLNDEVVYRGQTMELYNSTMKDHILRKLERKLDPNGLGVSAKISIEHIMPQKLTRAWEELLGPNAAQIRERLVHTIGNLTLSPYNSELGNKSFSEKVDLIKGGFTTSKLRLSESILQYEAWGESEILERGNYLMELAVSTWPLPDIYDSNYKKLEVNEEKEEISLLDLLREEIIQPDDEVFWARPSIGETYIARVTENGTLVVQSGDEYETPSAATRHFTTSSYNGWKEWRHLSPDGPTLNDKRDELTQQNY